MLKSKQCKFNDCTNLLNPKSSRGWCSKHYIRWYRYGDPGVTHCIRGKERLKHPLYATHQGMKQRCVNPNQPAYPNYGGRGIKICDRWLGLYGFNNFVKDMGPRPQNYTLERIDNNGNYEPNNCKWASRKEQLLNRRLFKTNTSGHAGILKTTSGRWKAMCGYKYLGMFDTIAEAIQAREHEV